MVFQEQKSQKSSKDKRGSAEDKKEKCQKKAEKKQLKAMAKKGILKPKPDRPEMMSLEDNVDEELPPPPAGSSVQALDGASEVVKFSSVEDMDDADVMRQAKVKEMERVILEKNRRIEHLEERNLYLEEKVEGLENRILVIGDRKRLRVRTEQEIFPVIQHMDTTVKTTQAANANLKQRLEEALNSKKELEASLQDLQKRFCEEATEVEKVVKFSSVEEMEDADVMHQAEELPPPPAGSNVQAPDGASEVVKFSIFEEMEDADVMHQAEELPPPPAGSNVQAPDGASEDWFKSFIMNVLCCAMRDK